MKLNKIHIDNYKNLAHDFSFEQADKYIALIGLNGSGKSNVLESISFLFSQAMRVCQKQKTTLNINQELATLVKYT